MNYTITFSPSIDYVINNDNFNQNGLTRINEYYLLPGGKGINASFIMNEISVKNKAIIFTYGQTKPLFINLLKKYNINNYTNIDLNNNIDIRINVKYFGSNSFEINGPSPKLSKNEFDLLKEKLSKLNKKDIVFIMGKCDEKILINLIKFIKDKGAEFVIDIDSSILLKILKFNPLLIKPNKDELQSLLNKKITSEKQILDSLYELKSKGAKNVIVSLGGSGSLLIDEEKNVYKAKFEKLNNVKSTVGCGDTLVSSFISYKYNMKFNSEESLKKSTAMSMATATEWFLGKESISKKMLNKISVIKINKK